ncbi:MAG: ion transporter [Muribaculaceae bacterium]|nr:ion transporter [Muribaculaceae bacterium]
MENKNSLRAICTRIATSKIFDYLITFVIIVNSVLIGMQVTDNSPTIEAIQSVILYIFTFEIIVRFIAAGSIKAFFSGGWNNFDLILVVIGWIPPSISTNAHTMMALRVLRVFRVLRLLRTAKEIKLIISVLLRSMKSIFYNGILFVIFVYLYAVAGVSMFRMPDPANLSGEQLQRYEKLLEEAPNAPGNSPDPYGSISEASFTLFRALTGEDWTDLRYNLITASELGVIKVPPIVITVFHVSWFCIAAFLLLNLLTGAVINNYQLTITEEEEHKKHPLSDAASDGPDK